MEKILVAVALFGAIAAITAWQVWAKEKKAKRKDNEK